MLFHKADVIKMCTLTGARTQRREGAITTHIFILETRWEIFQLPYVSLTFRLVYVSLGNEVFQIG
jgi:hypothetical protein